MRNSIRIASRTVPVSADQYHRSQCIRPCKLSQVSSCCSRLNSRVVGKRCKPCTTPVYSPQCILNLVQVNKNAVIVEAVLSSVSSLNSTSVR
jgi:hypothetical protein